MEWTVDTRIPNPCFGKGANWNKVYDVCMKMKLPLAEVTRFDHSSSGHTFSEGI